MKSIIKNLNIIRRILKILNVPDISVDRGIKNFKGLSHRMELVCQNDKIKFILIATSKKLNLDLEKENFETYYFSLNILSRYIAYLRNFSPFVRSYHSGNNVKRDKPFLALF